MSIDYVEYFLLLVLCSRHIWSRSTFALSFEIKYSSPFWKCLHFGSILPSVLGWGVHKIKSFHKIRFAMINGLTVRQLRPTFRLSPSQQKTQIVGESVTHCGWKSSAEPQGRSSSGFICAHDRLYSRSLKTANDCLKVNGADLLWAASSTMCQTDLRRRWLLLSHFFIPTFRLKQILTAKAWGGKDLLRKALPKFVNQN